MRSFIREQLPSIALLVVTLLCIGIGGPDAATTGSLRVLWDANTTDPDVAQYRVYVATSPGVFNLTPAQAASQSRTVTVPASATETTVPALDPAVVYWVAVTALDTSANESIFSDVASGQPDDVTLPTVVITSPAASAVLIGSVAITATASDDVGVEGVQIQLDGGDLGAELSTSPYASSWNTATASDGLHTLSAIARDAAGNTASSAAVTVQVRNSTPAVCYSGLDADGDGICDATDNCPTIPNTNQANTDNDYEGGDACDITVTSPLNGDITCADPPPTVSWSRETYDQFRVFVGTNPNFSVKITSGKKMLPANSWGVPATSWTTICNKTGPYLFIKVLGKRTGSKIKEFSEVGSVRVK